MDETAAEKMRRMKEKMMAKKKAAEAAQSVS